MQSIDRQRCPLCFYRGPVLRDAFTFLLFPLPSSSLALLRYRFSQLRKLPPFSSCKNSIGHLARVKDKWNTEGSLKLIVDESNIIIPSRKFSKNRFLTPSPKKTRYNNGLQRDFHERKSNFRREKRSKICRNYIYMSRSWMFKSVFEFFLLLLLRGR